MSIITLTTDFGNKDYFVGAVKGAILRELPSVTIVDISHEISPFNIPEAAYTISNAYTYFPKGTIHIIGIDAEWNPENKHVVVKFEGQYFISSDNGILSILLKDKTPAEQFEIKLAGQEKSIFPVVDIFVKTAVHIAHEGPLSALGTPIEKINRSPLTEANINVQRNQIIGYAHYIDHFGNVVFNISKTLFEEIRNGRKYKISAGSHKYPIDAIYDNYSDVVNFMIPAHERNLNGEGKALVVFNSAGFFQISIYKSNLKSVGGASTLLGLKYGSPVIIDFI